MLNTIISYNTIVRNDYILVYNFRKSPGNKKNQCYQTKLKYLRTIYINFNIALAEKTRFYSAYMFAFFKRSKKQQQYKDI